MKILIGSKNSLKIKGAMEAFEKYYDNIDIDGIGVSSLVSEQPVNDEVYKGAKNRVDGLVKYAKENNIDYEYCLGIESGITNYFGKWVVINVAVIRNKDGYESIGISSGYPMPDKYVDEIIKTDLGKVMHGLFGDELEGSKGSISFLTHNVINRIDLTREAFIMALTQFINDAVWSDR